MISQRIATLASFLLVPLIVPPVLSASTAAPSRSIAMRAQSSHGVQATIQVANNSGQAANVILVDQGWYVLGLVNSKTTNVFDVPRDFVGTKDVTVLAPLQKVAGFQSEPMTLRPGREVNLTIPATLSELDVA